MRIGLGLTAGLLALAWASGSSLSAQTESAKAPEGATADTALQVLAPPATAVSRPASGATDPNGFRRPTKVADASPLTAEECTSAGGEVTTNDFSAALCASGKLCVRQDNKGKNHAVCLSVK